MPVFIRHLEYALAPEIDEQGQIRTNVFKRILSHQGWSEAVVAVSINKCPWSNITDVRHLFPDQGVWQAMCARLCSIASRRQTSTKSSKSVRPPCSNASTDIVVVDLLADDSEPDGPSADTALVPVPANGFSFKELLWRCQKPSNPAVCQNIPQQDAVRGLILPDQLIERLQADAKKVNVAGKENTKNATFGTNCTCSKRECTSQCRFQFSLEGPGFDPRVFN